MATTQLNGVNYETDGRTITFFGAKGTKVGSNRWAINGIMGDLLFEVSPESVMPVVHECINADVKDGNADKLAMLLLAPRSAVLLYLEGRLTSQHLIAAVEGPDYIDVPNVDFDGHTLTVRILRVPKYNVATADSDGNVL
jgi:hypothetical protein